MGEKYPFPTSPTDLERLAQQAVAQADWATACQLYQQLYQAEPSFEHNQQLAAVLAQDEQFQLAYALQTEYLTDYQQATSEIQQAAFKRVLAAQQFVAAYRWRTWLPQAQQVAALQEIQLAERHYQQQAQAPIAQLERDLFHIDEQPIYQQLILLKQAQQLPLAHFKTVMARLLVNPFLHPLMRATSLEMLVQIKCTTSFTFETIQQQQITVVPATLVEILQVPVIQTLKERLTATLGTTDPIMTQALQETIDLHAAYLYPLASQIMTEPADDWLAVYQAVYQQQKTSLTTKQQQILDWQQRLDRLTAQLNL
ncbi:hypothetical protein [Loigolactobacillus bifermentans]|uniref:TPR repeat-containing protein n=1 Tax=Loigolactobacillus bifermentans DSM 20003 TaxID=1423726 RepID=A0A0R1GJ24_9LACO|nr:hypothetical protein [Loigolactobacillus bifermentans]KRK34118.1 hypothetical protein FC07_GL000680 [Loigolactobacillus bifermentans DSM 20003]QGG59240.1 hypothetical protein LB003_01470 [Loigolactobacillus bifermentans]